MFDLHTHTTASDGTLTPLELVRLSIRAGLRYLAITDHDTLSGIEEAQHAAERQGILRIIPGVELSIEVAQGEIHILGYFINIHHDGLATRLIDLRNSRERRVDRILEKLRDQGISIDRKFLAKFHKGESIGRPHIARAMVEKGVVKSTRDAFERFIGKGGCCYAPREKISLQEALQLVIDAGGIPVLAHPGFLENFTEDFPTLLKLGLMGIEAHYALHTPMQTAYFLEMAQRHNLTVTAGTDFHEPGVKKYQQPGCPGVPRQVIDEFLEFCSRRTHIPWYTPRVEKDGTL